MVVIRGAFGSALVNYLRKYSICSRVNRPLPPNELFLSIISERKNVWILEQFHDYNNTRPPAKTRCDWTPWGGRFFVRNEPVVPFGYLIILLPFGATRCCLLLSFHGPTQIFIRDCWIWDSLITWRGHSPSLWVGNKENHPLAMRWPMHA